jgi:hypothetical protein
MMSAVLQTDIQLYPLFLVHFNLLSFEKKKCTCIAWHLIAFLLRSLMPCLFDIFIAETRWSVMLRIVVWHLAIYVILKSEVCEDGVNVPKFLKRGRSGIWEPWRRGILWFLWNETAEVRRVWGCWLDLCGSGWGSVKCCNDPLGCIKDREFLDCLGDYQLFEMDLLAELGAG